MILTKTLAAWLSLLAIGIAAAFVVVLGGNSGLPAAIAETEEVNQRLRVSAQRLETGEVQFAVRVADSAGGWSDPIEPRINSFRPSARRANRWLSSSGLTLERLDDAPSLTGSESFMASEIAPVALYGASSEWAGEIHYEAGVEDGDLTTVASLYSAASGTVDGELRIDLSCKANEVSVVIGGLLDSGRSARTVARTVTWSVDGGRIQSERWSPWPVEGALELLPPANSGLVAALLSGGRSMTLNIDGRAISTTFDLTALQATPVYANLAECDLARTVQIGNTEIRIQAFLHQEAGTDSSRARIEFALQQRGEDGQWGERILPSARRMPAYGDPTNWLSSSPVTVAFDLETVHRDVSVIEPVGDVVIADAAVSPRLGAGASAGGVEFNASYDAASNSVTSILRQHSNGPLVLEVSCAGDERSVALGGLPDDADDAISFVLDDQESSVHWDEGAFDDERVIQRLSDASTLTVGPGSAAESTFDLSRLLASPIQRNIDQCGNYSDPAWMVFNEEVWESLGEGISYNNSYGDRGVGHGLNSHISQDGRLGIGIDCLNVTSSRAWTQSYVWPRADEIVLEAGNHIAKIWTDGFLDGRTWQFVRHTDDGPLHIARDQLDAYHALLRSSSSARIEFNLTASTTVEVNTGILFSSPVQVNIDNCGTPFWPVIKDYVPFADVEESGRVSYSARQDSSRPGTISTNISTMSREEATADLQIRLGCFRNDELHVVIDHLPEMDAGHYPVTYRIDDGPIVNERWQSWKNHHSAGGVTSSISAPNPTELMASLYNASSISVVVLASGLEPFSFNLAGLFETPLQENIDNCGFYVEGNSIDLRVTFRRLADARVEFGLQWQFANGSWSERQLQAHRFIPATAPVDSWLVSSAFEVPVGRSTLEARIRAQRLAEGGNEFDLQIRTPNGDWQAFQLQHRILLPADADVDVWYTSTPLPVMAPGPTRMLPLPFLTSGETTVDGMRLNWSRRHDTMGGARVFLLLWAEEDVQSRDTRLTFVCSVAGPGILFNSPHLGELTEDTIMVDWQIDDGAVQSSHWKIVDYGTQKFPEPDSARSMIEAMRDGESLTLTFHGASQVQRVYSLAAMWDSPIQDTIDECIDAEPSVHSTMFESPLEDDGSLAHRALAVGGSEGITTDLLLRVLDDEAPSWAGYSSRIGVICIGARAGLAIDGIGFVGGAVIDGDTVEVTWRVDNGLPRTETWDAWEFSTGYSISPQDDSAFLAAINGANTLSISVASDPVFTETYELGEHGFWETPVQPNLTNCGPGVIEDVDDAQVIDDAAVEEDAPPFVTYGSNVADGQTQSWHRGRDFVRGVMLVSVSAWPTGSAASGDSFSMDCSDGGPAVILSVQPALGDGVRSITVRWQVDDQSVNVESWQVESAPSKSRLWPDNAREFYEAIREGSALTLTIEADPAINRAYNLSALFANPIQESLDECVEAEVPGAEVATESPPVDGDVFAYVAYRRGGVDAVTTDLRLSVLDDQAPGWVGYSSRLGLTCVVGRPGISIIGIGLVGSYLIAGETVEVTWRAGDGARYTDTWDSRELGDVFYVISPQDDSVVFNAINGADSFSVSVASEPVFTETYELAKHGFWETPVQPNLDACGGDSESE